MFDSDTWQEIASSVKAHKLRTALTAFGVFWGIFMLVMLMGIGGGLEHGVLRNFSGSAVNSLYVWGERTSLPYRGLQPGRWIELTNEDTAALRSSFGEITLLAPSVSLWGEYTVDRRALSGSFHVRGDVPDFVGINERRMTEGRFLNARDVEEHRKVAVIGSRVREVLFETDEDPVGTPIRINGVYFTVVGVFAVDSLQGGRRDAEMIHIPLPTLQRTFHQNNRIGHYAIAIDEAYPMEEVEGRIKAFLAARHTIAPDDRQAIGSWNNAREYRQLTGLFRGIRLFLLIVGVGTITAGIVGVSNVMLIVVKERTREIGIRKALGATPRSIVGLVLQESVIITATAGYLGLVAGVGLVELIGYTMERFQIESEYFSRPEADLGIAVLALSLLVAAGVLAGLFPALRAARIKPVEALKEE